MIRRSKAGPMVRTGFMLFVLAAGVGIGYAASDPGIAWLRDLPAHDAGFAAAARAEKLAGSGSWETIAAARIHYLAGDRAKAVAMMEPILRKPGRGDLQQIGELHAEAGETALADALFQQVIAASPKDDWGQMEMAAWYLRLGRREQGEALFGKALERSPKRARHFLRAAEGYLNVPSSP